VHARHLRLLVDLPVAGRSVVVELQIRRLVCAVTQCPQRTFREQVPELARVHDVKNSRFDDEGRAPETTMDPPPLGAPRSARV
jgi:hypothetical protein